MPDIESVINILRELTGTEVSQSDIARSLNITRAAVSKRVKSRSSLKIEEIKTLSRSFGVSLIKVFINNTDNGSYALNSSENDAAENYVKRLKIIREHLGLSVSEFSKRLELPQEALREYELGEKSPSAELFIQLDKKFNINLNWFVSGRGGLFQPENTSSAVLAGIFTPQALEILKKEGLI